MNTREVINRFESERQALAAMDHLAIARTMELASAEILVTPAVRIARRWILFAAGLIRTLA